MKALTVLASALALSGCIHAGEVSFWPERDDFVAGLSKKTIDLKGIVKSKNAFKGVKVENINGAVEISVFICVKQNARVKEVAEKVQSNIKEKIQSMTGNAVTQVNVNVADIEFDGEEQ